MTWANLLNWIRIGGLKADDIDEARPPWQMDYDRIIFSAAFRRLQDKTQVFPLSGSDYVRTRLTHSLEVSTVSRTLGMIVGHKILLRHGDEEVAPLSWTKSNEKKPLKDVFSPSDFGTIVATAALAHDLGNPPFGHSGEDAVRSWYLHSPTANAYRSAFGSGPKHEDFAQWEGNAQGFRILTRLQMARNDGGLRLTAPCLATFTKYPLRAIDVRDSSNTPYKKNGVFLSEYQYLEEIAAATGLIPLANRFGWCRHPLTYLMEAADDLCNMTVDFEDGFRLGHLSYECVKEGFLNIVGGSRDGTEKRLNEQIDNMSRIGYLRAIAIGELVKQTSDAYERHEEQILRGEPIGDLISKTTAGRDGGPIQTIKSFLQKNVFSAERVIQTEAAGFEIIGGLLDLFVSAVDEIAGPGTPSPKAEKILKLIPLEFLGSDGRPDEDPYERLLKMTDYVTGMTDSYALSLYRRLKGMALPS